MANKTSFETGDVLDIPRGAYIALPIEERFIFRNRPDSTRIQHEVVQLGDFLHAEGNAELDTASFSGKYVVLSSQVRGQASGMTEHDVSSPKLKITAQRLDRQGDFDPNGITVHFYCNPDGSTDQPGQVLPSVIGKMQRVFVYTPDQFNALDFVASMNCEANSGIEWGNTTDEQREFWRNEARNQIGEWSSKLNYNRERGKRKCRSAGTEP